MFISTYQWVGVGSAKLFKRLGNERAISGCGLKIFLNQSEDGISQIVFQHLTVYPSFVYTCPVDNRIFTVKTGLCTFLQTFLLLFERLKVNFNLETHGHTDTVTFGLLELLLCR